MTRINVVPVQWLSRKHLVAEYREIVRVFALVRNANDSGRLESIKIPENYILGTGHVKFFYDKLTWVTDRYIELVDQMTSRDYVTNPVPIRDLLEGIPVRNMGHYKPSKRDLKINLERLIDRNTDLSHTVYELKIACL